MKSDMIPLIHNYCDRWCERCAFVERCTVGMAEKDYDQTDPRRERWYEMLQKSFAEIRRGLEKMMREFGLDPEEVAQMPLPDPDPDLEALAAKMREKSMAYAKRLDLFFKENEAFFDEKSTETVQQIELDLPVSVQQLMQVAEAIATLRWFQYFIGAKIHRAVKGRDTWLEDDGDPLQSDANGSAKICQIAVGESLVAWEFLRQSYPEKTDEILDLLVQLRDIQRDMERLFPDWRRFHRPGFDDEPGFARFVPN